MSDVDLRRRVEAFKLGVSYREGAVNYFSKKIRKGLPYTDWETHLIML